MRTFQIGKLLVWAFQREEYASPISRKQLLLSIYGNKLRNYITPIIDRYYSEDLASPSGTRVTFLAFHVLLLLKDHPEALTRPESFLSRILPTESMQGLRNPLAIERLTALEGRGGLERWLPEITDRYLRLPGGSLWTGFTLNEFHWDQKLAENRWDSLRQALVEALLRQNDPHLVKIFFTIVTEFLGIRSSIGLLDFNPPEETKDTWEDKLNTNVIKILTGLQNQNIDGRSPSDAEIAIVTAKLTLSLLPEDQAFRRALSEIPQELTLDSSILLNDENSIRLVLIICEISSKGK